MDGVTRFDDFKPTPYWWDRTPRPEIPASDPPQTADLVVVGSGYTGLSAALQVARAGRSVVVFDADDAGWGCSSRNGGLVSGALKPSYAALSAKHGAEKAFRILKEAQDALGWLGDFIAEEGIDCDFHVPGKFTAAHNPARFDAMVADIRDQPKGLEIPYTIVPRADQHRELGTDAYHGGIVTANNASVDPARYHKGLLDRAIAAGVTIVPHCAVTDISGSKADFRVETARGSVLARDVMIATNGYTGSLSPWQRRRVIPIGSYMIATEALPKDVMDRIMPTDRVVGDSRKVVYYYRPSPDRTRVIFGGRVSAAETNTSRSAALLRRDLVALFPELADVRLSHSWMGFVAYTFDHLPHTGEADGVHYAMGYCGSGVSMASYLGMRSGQKILGRAEGRTAFDEIPFSTRPLYSGTPWFLSTSVAYFRWRDSLNI